MVVPVPCFANLPVVSWLLFGQLPVYDLISDGTLLDLIAFFECLPSLQVCLFDQPFNKVLFILPALWSVCMEHANEPWHILTGSFLGSFCTCCLRCVSLCLTLDTIQADFLTALIRCVITMTGEKLDFWGESVKCRTNIKHIAADFDYGCLLIGEASCCCQPIHGFRKGSPWRKVPYDQGFRIISILVCLGGKQFGIGTNCPWVPFGSDLVFWKLFYANEVWVCFPLVCVRLRPTLKTSTEHFYIEGYNHTPFH